MQQTLRLVTPADRLVPSQELSGLLFECASDSPIRGLYPNCRDLGELIGSFEKAKVHAYALSKKLLHGEPQYRGVAQLGIFEEILVREAQFAFHLIHLHNRLADLGVSVGLFKSPSRWADGLRIVATICGGRIRIECPTRSVTRASAVRSLTRLVNDGFSVGSLRRELGVAARRIDPYHRLTRWNHIFPRRRYLPDGIWYYSTAVTFTNVGMRYEPYFPSRFNYLIENSLTGGVPLRKAGRGYFNLYDFAMREDEPTRDEIHAAAQGIERHLRNVPLAGDEAIARDVVLGGVWYSQFVTTHLLSGLFHSALFGRWVEAVRPLALVVGNPVFEGYALHAAKKRGIPTILLQHGILGDFCQFVDPPVDRYVVRGQFWQEFLARTAREHSVILDAPDAPLTAGRNVALRESGHVLFLTAPYSTQEFWHKIDRTDILVAVLKAAATVGRRIVVRVHPLETIENYRTLIARLLPELGLDVPVTFSQGAGLVEAVSGACVAVMCASTVFLDCLKQAIPIVSFAWHDFAYRRQIQKRGVFHFAGNLHDLETLVVRAARCELPPFAAGTADFLARTPENELRSRLGVLVAGTSGPR